MLELGLVFSCYIYAYYETNAHLRFGLQIVTCDPISSGPDFQINSGISYTTEELQP